MAGNTRFIGFGTNGTLNFERWGGKAEVQVDYATYQKFMTMCRRRLPTAPAAPRSPPGTQAKFNAQTGAIDFLMDDGEAADLAELLRFKAQELRVNNGANYYFAERNDRLADMLETALKARDDYFDLDEPGVVDES